MAIFASHEEKSTPWIKDFASDLGESAEGKIYTIDEFIFTEKGVLITVMGDEFVTFVFKAQGIHRKLKSHLTKSLKAKKEVNILQIQLDDSEGSFSIIESDSMGYVDGCTTSSGNLKRCIRPIEI